jgi:hypothetical protein
MVMILLSGVIPVKQLFNVNGKTKNVILMEELDKRRKIMTDSFLSTKMKQLKNIQATVESTTGETQEMWINKWYELIRSIAKEIESNKQQAPSNKTQAASNKPRAVISNKEVTSLKRSELMKFLQWHYSQNYLKSLSIEDLRRLYKDWQKHHNVI